MRLRLVAVGTGLVLIVTALVLVLSDREPRLAATNTRVHYSGDALELGPGEQRCQAGEYVPRAATRVRVYTASREQPVAGPISVAVHDASGRTAATGGTAEARPSGPVDVPMTPLPATLDPGELCVRNEGTSEIVFAGNLTPANTAAAPGPNGPGQRATDEVRADWFRPGEESWWEVAGEVARRMALFKPSFAGSALLWVLLAFVGVIWAVTGLALVRGDRWRPVLRVPLAGWVCAAVAVGSAWVWALVTPPLQVPDEGVHIGYTEFLAESGRPPRRLPRPPRSLSVYSEEFAAVYQGVPFSTEGKPSWSPTLDRRLDEIVDGDLSRKEELGAGTAATYPPGYYVYEAVAARAGSFLDAIDRLYLLRLWSGLLAGVTVGFVFLFLRELLPTTPWAWTVGALAVAFQPVFSFLTGGVNNDGLLYVAGAGTLYCLARAFRRGLTLRLGMATGLAVAIGLLTKPTMIGLVPAVALAVVALVVRGERRHQLGPRRGGAAALALPVAIVSGWLVVDVALFNRTAGAMTGGLASERVSAAATTTGQLTYLWQFFLPKLPFMEQQFSGYWYPVWHVYIQGFIGRFGWFEYGFPSWVNVLGLVVLLAVTALAVVSLARHRRSLRRRWVELATYVMVVAGVLLMVAVSGYRYKASLGFSFEQTRYLFPMLALYGGVVAVAVRGLGRRWGPALGAFVTTLFMGHWLFAILLTLQRYYA